MVVKKKRIITIVLVILILVSFVYSVMLYQGKLLKPFVSSEEIAKCKGNCWDLDFSPDGERFAYFDSQRNHGGTIVLMDVDGGNRKELGENPGWSVPLFSDDNRHIIYLADNSLHIADSDGENQRILVNGTVQTVGFEPPNYDISGQSVVFSRDGNLSMIGTDGNGEQQRTTEGGYGPLFSPDGKKIVYIRNDDEVVMNARGDVDYNRSIHVMNSDGSGDLELARYSFRYYIKNMQFHPDGDRVFYTVEVRNHPVESDNGIWSASISTGDLVRYTDSDDSFGFFDHDGRSFFYLGNVWIHHHNFVRIDIDDSDETVMSRPNDYFSGSDIHPEEDIIVYDVGHDFPFRRGLWIMETDGSHELKIEDDGAAPHFTPDGTSIIYWKTEAGGEYDHSLHRIDYDSLRWKIKVVNFSPFVVYPLVVLGISWLIYKKRADEGGSKTIVESGGGNNPPDHDSLEGG